MTETLRDHARAAVRDEVSRHAWLLFAEQGFELTTVDQIASAAGMSRRTFFRYFAGKDELVLDRMIEAGDRIAAVLRARPVDEPAWAALRAAFDVIVVPQDDNPDRARQLQLMLRDEPTLRAVVQERRRRWHDLLEPLVGVRLPAREGDSGPDVRAAAVAGSALACLEVAQLTWAEHPGSRLGALVDEAMAAGAEVSAPPR